MQKVIHVDYSETARFDKTERLSKLNSYLEQGWKVVLTQPVRQEVTTDGRGYISGEYGVTFVIQKD